MTKDIFCTKEQKVTAHEASLTPTGEFLFTCTTEDCGRFIKFPADTENLDELLTAHEYANTGQVSIEAQEKKLEELIG